MQTPWLKQRGCKAGTGRGPGVGRGVAAWQVLPGDVTKQRLEGCPAPTRVGSPGGALEVPLAPPPTEPGPTIVSAPSTQCSDMQTPDGRQAAGVWGPGQDGRTEVDL